MSHQVCCSNDSVSSLRRCDSEEANYLTKYIVIVWGRNKMTNGEALLFQYKNLFQIFYSEMFIDNIVAIYKVLLSSGTRSDVGTSNETLIRK